jgi:catechol 1,2-dioxygenase
MAGFCRREFFKCSGLSLAALGLGSAALVLSQDEATPSSGGLGSYGDYLKQKGTAASSAPGKFSPTEDNIQGPFYREGAPFRAKITPPLEPGTVLLVSGTVWAFDTKKPLANAAIDVWQANHVGRYDNDDPKVPPEKNAFKYRSRVVTDEKGYYEYETIHPGRYKIGRDLWRPAHIHYLVQHAGYKTLVTQLYFKGDPYNDKDEFIKPSLIINLDEKRVADQRYESGRFDIVLAKA